jgi:4-aminobutyrate aminotransferase-like enzyme/Ser/Thr protein kinase RdoA (MazF antagonist)
MLDAQGFDAVLTADPPTFDESEAVVIAARAFALDATSARNLGSERDQAFLLLDGTEPLAVMKISNPAEDPEILDMEALVVRHAARVDPDLPIASPLPRPGTTNLDDPLTYRVHHHERGRDHWLRVYRVLPGHSRTDPTLMSDAALSAFGATSARLGRALRGFFHRRAERTMLWDMQHALRSRAFLPSVADPHTRDLAQRTLDRFEQNLGPQWPSLRAQVIHTDLTPDNSLLDDDGFVTGIIDFGDMSHTALLVDLASVLEALCDGRADDDRLRAARLVIDGYQRVTPLEPIELALLGELWATRCAISIAIKSWRVERGLEDGEFAQRNLDDWVTALELFHARGWDRIAKELGAETFTPDAASLARRRDIALGPAIEPLSYDTPIHVASGEGCWFTTTSGERILDAYNNVPCVGHAHPRVAEAIARQARRVNTNMRYLHDRAVELAERLRATMPDGLDTVFFVNSGSEANDLAWRMAKTFTGNEGGLCTDWAYHGISDAIAPFSPETWPPHRTAPVESWKPADALRRRHLDDTEFSAAVERLRARDLRLAATILDGVMQSDGVLVLEPAYVRRLVDLTHSLGGLWIADEVQGGHGRSGEHLWSFERFGIVPDFVTLGKPMGNGHPVAAVITRREIAQAFADETVFFSTFGGNPVSVAAAHAVLDVLDDERVLERTRIAGELLRIAVREVAADHGCIAEVRGMGLANGIEIVHAGSTDPDGDRASRIKNALRRHGVLVGSCGRASNVLKVRPPLAFTASEVPILVTALRAALDDAR